LLKTARRTVHSGGGREGGSDNGVLGRIVMAGTGERDMSTKQGNLETDVGVEKVVVAHDAGKL
jgi:hypothetical protein